MNNETKHLITATDLDRIIEEAKRLYSTEVFPVAISKRDLHPTKLPNLFMVQAFLSYANKHGLLNKPVDLDITGRQK